MSDVILFVNTMKVSPGELSQFKQNIRAAVEFVEANGPQLMVEIFIDKTQGRAYSFQLYSDSASIRTHWQMSDPYIDAVMEHATVERLDIYGEPDESVMESVQGFTETGVEVSVRPHLAGFHRLISPEGT